MIASYSRSPIEPTALGERILALLGEGSFSATYKYALLMALVDSCMEMRPPLGLGPHRISARLLAEKVVGYYWGHTLPYESSQLRQNNRGQAEIVKLISEHRAYSVCDASTSVTRAKEHDPQSWKKLLDQIEWKLIEMPLPRLQTVGNRYDDFLYTIGWGRDVRLRDVRARQRGDLSGPEFEIMLNPGVAEGLVRLGPLLKPLVRRRWTDLVAKFNRLQVSRLEEFLFGEGRAPLRQACDVLAHLQAGKCFFCGKKLSGNNEVDHFIPWSRYSNNAIENLVLADAPCNNDKRDYLASTEHLDTWVRRIAPGSRSIGLLEDFSRTARWDYWPDRSRNVASTIYLGLPDGYSLWRSKGQFVPALKHDVKKALGI